MRAKTQDTRHKSARAQVKIIYFLFMFFFILVFNCYAGALSSTELIEKANSLDGEKITYKGELITAVLRPCAGHSWLNLNDGANAIGVWCESSQLGMVKFAGDYKKKGDIIEITGEFHRACPEHGGELDIHADSIKLIKKGYLVGEILDFKRIKSSAILFFLTILTVIIFRKKF